MREELQPFPAVPVLGYNYGEELVKTAASYVNDDLADEDTADIYIIT